MQPAKNIHSKLFKMNRLRTPRGGMPLHLDDLNWMQDAVKEALRAIYDPFKDSVGELILSGLEVVDNGTTIDLTEGYVAISGEICYCPGQTVTVPAGNGLNDIYIVIDITYDSNGNDDFADLQARDTHQIRRAKLIYTTSPPLQSFLLDGKKRLEDGINDFVDANYLQDELTGFGGSLSNGFAEYEDAKRNKRFNEVYLTGKISGGDTNANTSILLPQGMYPTHNLAFVCAMTKAPYSCLAIVRTDGTIDFTTFPSVSLDSNLGEYICLNSIRFTV